MNGPQAKEERRKPLLVRFPLKFRSKEPAVRFKSRDVFNIEGIENVGERLDGMLVLDIDPKNMPESVTLAGTLDELRGMGVPVDACPRVRTGSGGEHVKMRLPDGAPRLKAKLLPWVDVKSGRGAYVVAAGSVHPNGNRYEALNDVAADDAPFAPPQLLKNLERTAPSGEASPPGLLDGDRLAIVLQALDPTEFRNHDRWLDIMMTCRHACPEGEAEFVEWSTSDPDYVDHAQKIADRWHSVDPLAKGGVTVATLYERVIEAKTARPDEPAPRRALAVMDFAGLEPEAPSTELNAEERGALEQYMFVDEGGDIFVYRELYDDTLERKYWAKYTPASFKLKHGDRLVETPFAQRKILPLGDAWLKWPKRRQYDGIAFKPEHPPGVLPGGALNLWQGFSVEPSTEGSWSLLGELVRDSLAGGDAASADYILDWMAHAVQRPHVPAEVALVFRGDKGTGKGTLGRAFFRLFGRHGMHITSPALIPAVPPTVPKPRAS